MRRSEQAHIAEDPTATHVQNVGAAKDAIARLQFERLGAALEPPDAP